VLTTALCLAVPVGFFGNPTREWFIGISLAVSGVAVPISLRARQGPDV
jgi:hypothetical protein